MPVKKKAVAKKEAVKVQSKLKSNTSLRAPKAKKGGKR